jgi:hypothetical protein
MKVRGAAIEHLEQDLREIEIHTLLGIGSGWRIPYLGAGEWTGRAPAISRCR